MSLGVENFFPGLWGIGISDAIFNQFCIHATDLCKNVEVQTSTSFLGHVKYFSLFHCLVFF